MLIDEYEVELSCPACEPGAEIWAATVATAADLSELIPYVNALVERGEYTPSVPTLIWREGEHKLFVRAHQIGISNLRDRPAGESKVAELVRFLNETWERRDAISPDFAVRTRLKVLDVLKHLPRTNCGQCGVPSCMAFAVALSQGDRSLDECPPLLDAGAEGRRMLAELGL